jgi:hypothetical protein
LCTQPPQLDETTFDEAGKPLGATVVEVLVVTISD